jgi:hypothetical protein
MQYVTVDSSGHIRVNVHNANEARIAVKELRVLKKALAVQKRQVANEQQAIRAQYTDTVRRQGSMFRGGGGFGRFIRWWQRAERDANRAHLARALEPLELRRQKIEAALISVDGVIARLEAKKLGSG